MSFRDYVNSMNESSALNEGYGRVNVFFYQGVGKKKRLPITGSDLPKFFNSKGLALFRDREKFTKTTIGLGKNINKWDNFCRKYLILSDNITIDDMNPIRNGDWGAFESVPNMTPIFSVKVNSKDWIYMVFAVDGKIDQEFA
jgi:hypothetical protein